jgi:hypothetical protein
VVATGVGPLSAGGVGVVGLDAGAGDPQGDLMGDFVFATC